MSLRPIRPVKPLFLQESGKIFPMIRFYQKKLHLNSRANNFLRPIICGLLIPSMVRLIISMSENIPVSLLAMQKKEILPWEWYGTRFVMNYLLVNGERVPFEMEFLY